MQQIYELSLTPTYVSDWDFKMAIRELIQNGIDQQATNSKCTFSMEFVPNENMSGLDGIMHGGFSLMIMDEVMFYAVESYEIDSVTLNSNVDFKSPAILGHTLTAEAWVAKRDGRKLFVEGELRDGDTVVVTSKGLYYEMDMSSFLPDKE